jgi:hypothetical protein
MINRHSHDARCDATGLDSITADDPTDCPAPSGTTKLSIGVRELFCAVIEDGQQAVRERSKDEAKLAMTWFRGARARLPFRQICVPLGVDASAILKRMEVYFWLRGFKE